MASSANLRPSSSERPPAKSSSPAAAPPLSCLTSSRASPSRSSRGSSASADSLGSRTPPASSDRRTSQKPSPSSEKRVPKVSDLQHQLNQKQEEMKRLKEERHRALRDLEDAKKRIDSQDILNEDLKLFRRRVDFLEMEVEKAKDSERKMLESLVSITKQLETTKISLEEAKLEVRTLEGGGRRSIDGVEEEEMALLRNELRLALRAEEKSKKAMDDLAVALKEVSTEANQMNGELLDARSELQDARDEAERSKSLLSSAEDRRRAAFEASERLRFEFQESMAAWSSKEAVFINLVAASEEEIAGLKQENDRLIDSLRACREENAKLRDILKQAVNEASIVKEALEIAMNENCHLKDMIAESESSLRGAREEYECIKASEAAAIDGANELRGLLAAATASNAASELDNKTMATMSRSSSASRMATNESGSNRTVHRFASDRWRAAADDGRSRNGWRRSSGGSGRQRGSASEPTEASPERERENMFDSIVNISDWKVPPAAVAARDEQGVSSFEDYDHLDADHLDALEPPETGTNQMKKKHVIGMFGDMFRRRSFRKQR